MITYDCDYEWGQGREIVIAQMLDFTRNWTVNEDRADYDFHIWDGMYGFVKIGTCLKNLALGKIYKKKFKTFKQFCERYLKISAELAKQYIKASEAWLELASATKDDEDGETISMFDKLPQNISQTIPLTKLSPAIDIETGESELTKTWGKVIASTNTHNKGKLTAKAVKEIVDGPLPDKKHVVVDEEIYALINNLAGAEGLSNKDFLTKLVKQYNNEIAPVYTEEMEPEPEPEEKRQEAWREDLEQLIDESKKEMEPEPEPEPVRLLDFLDRPKKVKKKKAKYPFYDLASDVGNGEISAIISSCYVDVGAEYLVVEKRRSKKIKGEIRVTKVTTKLVGELTTDDLNKMGFKEFTSNQFISYCKSFGKYQVLDRGTVQFLNKKTRVEFIEFELVNFDYYS